MMKNRKMPKYGFVWSPNRSVANRMTNSTALTVVSTVPIIDTGPRTNPPSICISLDLFNECHLREAANAASKHRSRDAEALHARGDGLQLGAGHIDERLLRIPIASADLDRYRTDLTDGL